MKLRWNQRIALGLTVLMVLQHPAVSLAETGSASSALGAASWEEEIPEKQAFATSSDAEKKTVTGGDSGNGRTAAATDSDAEPAMFDEDGTLMDGEVLPDGEILADGAFLSAGKLDALLALEEATPLNAKKSILDMEIRTAEGVLQAGDVLQEAEPQDAGLQGEGLQGTESRKGKLNAMKAAAAADPLDAAIALLEEAADNWDGTEVEFSDGLALGIVADLSGLEIPADQDGKLFSRFLNRNPQYFFLSSYYLALPTEDERYISQLAPLIDMTYSIDDVQVFEDKVDEIVSYVDPSWSDEEKVLWLHDYIILTTAYDTDYSNFNAYNCLVEGDAVCQGYTLAYDHLLKQFGIEGDLISSATLQTGDDTEHVGHIWNLVKLDGKNYYVDVTKDDPLNSYRYWCRHLNLMNGQAACYEHNHQTTDWLNSEGEPVYDVLPASTDHDSWFWKNCYAAIPNVYGGWVYTDHTTNARYGNNEIRIYSYGAADTADADRLLAEFPDIWKNMDTGGRLTSRFIHFAESQDELVVSGPLNLYWLKEDGTLTSLYELSEEEQALGGIFGMRADFADDTVICYDLYRNRTSALQAERTLDLTDAFGIHVTSININTAEKIMAAGKTFQLKAWPQPVNATNKEVNWTSSDETVVTVDSTGLVKALKAGSAAVTVTSADSGVTAVCEITVKIPVTGVKINTTAKTMVPGKTFQLAAWPQPSNAANKAVTWTSSNTGVATVSSTGLVKAVKGGTANITVKTADGGYTATCKITVNIPVTGVRINTTAKTMTPGKTFQLAAWPQPSNAANKKVTWWSSNTAVATVSSTGLVKAVKAGTAVITVKTIDGGYRQTCKITVDHS